MYDAYHRILKAETNGLISSKFHSVIAFRPYSIGEVDLTIFLHTPEIIDVPKVEVLVIMTVYRIYGKVFVIVRRLNDL